MTLGGDPPYGSVSMVCYGVTEADRAPTKRYQ